MNVGDKVVITHVPERASLYVREGDVGVIEPYGIPEGGFECTIPAGLVKVKIGRLVFWWDERGMQRVS